MDMTGLDPLGDPRAPTMATAFPEVTTRVAAILRESGYPGLADLLPAQRFYGRCHCKPGCSFVLTAPPGSSGSLMVWLEVSGQVAGEASLDPAGRIITDFEIGDPKTAGIPPNWLEQGLAAPQAATCGGTRPPATTESKGALIRSPRQATTAKICG